MKYFTLCFLIMAPFLNAQQSLWKDEPINQLEYLHMAADFGLRGDVKSCMQTFETQNDQEEYEIKHGVWCDHHFIKQLNFNQQGQLTSRFEKTNKGDTMIIVFIDYDDQQRILKVQEHVANIWRKYERFPAKNWESRSLRYFYDKGLLVAIESHGNWGDPFNGNNHHRLVFEYEEDRVTKKTIQIGIPVEDTLNMREYKYLANSNKYKEINTIREGYTTTEGSMKFHYNEGNMKNLTGKSFIPKNPDELNQEVQWSYDSQENISSYMSGDTLQEMWYQYKEYKYNSKNDLVSEYTNMEMDGRARLTFEYTYKYDEKNNWKERFIKLNHDIPYGGGSTYDEFFRESQKIEYYD